MIFVTGLLLATGQWRQLRRVTRRDGLIAAAAGACLALHFWSWNASIGLTSVAASVLLVDTQPVLVAAASAMWLKEAPTRAQWWGIALAMLGAVVVVAPDLRGSIGTGGARAALGDLLALVGALTAAAYYLVGRRLRASLDLWAYVAIVYGACTLTLLALALATRSPLWPQPRRELAIFAALAVGPMMLGHTGLNWALRYLPAFVVNLTVLGEPIGATLLAAAIPAIHETPSPLIVIGGALLLSGIVIAMPRSAAPAPAD